MGGALGKGCRTLLDDLAAFFASTDRYTGANDTSQRSNSAYYDQSSFNGGGKAGWSSEPCSSSFGTLCEFRLSCPPASNPVWVTPPPKPDCAQACPASRTLRCPAVHRPCHRSAHCCVTAFLAPLAGFPTFVDNATHTYYCRPDDYTKCYAYVAVTSAWQTHRTACQKLNGGDLVVYESLQEQVGRLGPKLMGCHSRREAIRVPTLVPPCSQAEVEGYFLSVSGLSLVYWLGFFRIGTTATSSWVSVREQNKFMSVAMMSGGLPYYTHW